MAFFLAHKMKAENELFSIDKSAAKNQEERAT